MSDKIVVTGATGFLGRHLLPRLARRFGPANVVGLGSRDYDLTDRDRVRALFAEVRPDTLVHLAAYSGGIAANRQYPADFYYRNTLLTALVFDEAARSRVKKLVYLLGGCSYPAAARSPIDEGQMWDGFPQPESASYSTAKKMGLVASAAYRQQYGLNSILFIPGNLYGEYDNFRTGESHVIPALVRRFCESQTAAARQITLWGTGQPVRDFVYAGDVASALVRLIETYQSPEPVNISSGTATSIRQLAETIAELVGFTGDLAWDSSQPDGQRVKVFDVTRLRGLGLSCPTPLREGLRRTIGWFRENYQRRTDGIRL
jgi:GDP-L-fucose synthase